MPKDFKDKVVVITGSASGIGRATALAFAQRGALLSLADVNEKGLIEVKREAEAGGCGEARIEKVDVSDPEQVKLFRDNTYANFGRVDVLINNAGVGIGGRFEDMSLDDLEWVMGINLWGVLYGCHFFYPRMIADGGGHIINTASGAAVAPLPSMTAYSCTKGGVLRFSESLRAEAALHNIGVSAICPGFVRTNITKTSRAVTKADELAKQRVDKFYAWRNYPPSKVATAIVKAVERNTGVVIVSPEMHMLDAVYKVSRRLWGAIITMGVRSEERYRK